MYDPHLAPLIEAIIEEHRQQRRERQQQSVCINVHSPSVGRSSATFDTPPGRTLRRRRPAEIYELDESECHLLGGKDKLAAEHIEHSPAPSLVIPLEEKAVSSDGRSPIPSPAPCSRQDLPPLPESHEVTDSSPCLSSTSVIVGSTPDVMSDTGTGFSLTSPFIDAETYTPRSGTPISPHPLSPGIVHLSLSASDFTFPAPNVGSGAASGAPSRPSSPPMSTSSWADDEHWRSGSELDSEWDALSDAIPSR